MPKGTVILLLAFMAWLSIGLLIIAAIVAPEPWRTLTGLAGVVVALAANVIARAYR